MADSTPHFTLALKAVPNTYTPCFYIVWYDLSDEDFPEGASVGEFHGTDISDEDIKAVEAEALKRDPTVIRGRYEWEGERKARSVYAHLLKVLKERGYKAPRITDV